MILEYVSATQVSKYEECPRRWFESYVLKNREPETEAMRLGSAIHKEVEHYLKTGEVKAGPWSHLVEAVKPLVPVPGTQGMIVEHKFAMPTNLEGVEFVGYVDLGYQTADLPMISDWKSKDWPFRYLKTPEDLLEDVQLTVYAKWLLTQSDFPAIKLRLIYVERQPDQTKKPRTKEVPAVITREQIEARWQKTLKSVAGMYALAQMNQTTTEGLPYNVASCDLYGGCFYRENCGLDIMLEHQESLMPAENLTKGTKMGLMDRLNALKSQNTTGPGGTSTEVVAIEPIGAVGVVPPDAPDRDGPEPVETDLLMPSEPNEKRPKGKKKAADVVRLTLTTTTHEIAFDIPVGSIQVTAR